LGIWELSRIFHTLSDDIRLKLLFKLSDGAEWPYGTLIEGVTNQGAASTALQWLRLRNFVSSRRNGKIVFYRLGPIVVAERVGVISIQLSNLSLRLEEGPDEQLPLRTRLRYRTQPASAA
jgi:hypothetical protein